MKNPSPSGGLITGLPPTPTVRRQTPEVLWDLNVNLVPRDEDGIDTEGIAFANGSLYAIMQRPLSNPNSGTSETSQNIRILVVDLNAVLTGKAASPIKQLIYRTEPNARQRNAYASDLFAVSDSKFLVPERATDKLYCFDSGHFGPKS